MSPAHPRPRHQTELGAGSIVPGAERTAPNSPSRSPSGLAAPPGMMMPGFPGGGYPSPGAHHNPMMMNPMMAQPPAYTLGYNMPGYPPTVQASLGARSGTSNPGYPPLP